MLKHEIVACERCGTSIECKANNYTQCQCSSIRLSLNELQFVSENFDGCLCLKCLDDLKTEFAKITDL